MLSAIGQAEVVFGVGSPEVQRYIGFAGKCKGAAASSSKAACIAA